MAEIKIRELSIGDWVEWKASDKTYVIRITQITDTIICGVHDGIEYGMLLKQISPIPLTPEILEKNGWAEYSDVHNSWKLDIADNMRVWMFKNSHDWTFQVMNWGLGHNHCIAKAYITSIHQLQHALRLAGVEKDIVL